ncbi:MAG: restriction endonuclease subunit S [Chitinophagales bacterium]
MKKAIKSFAKVRRGASPRPISDSKYFGGEVGWIRISDVTKSNKFLNKTVQYLSALGETKSVRVDKGDLIMSICGTIGRPIIINIPACIHDGFVQFYDIKNTDNEFLYYSLQFAENDLKNHGQSGTQVNLNTTIVGNYKIFYPNKRTQTQIAKILSTIDTAIEQTKALIAKHERIKTGLMQDLLTKGIDEAGNIRSEQTHEFKDSPLGRIPKEWEVKKLKRICNVLVSNVDKKSIASQDKIRLCNYMDVYSNEYIYEKTDYMEATASKNQIKNFRLRKEDVIITKDSETPNDIAVPAVSMFDFKDLICGYHLAILRPNTKKIKGVFLMNQLLLKSVNKHFSKLANGSTRFGLTLGVIYTAPIPFPKNLEEQINIINIVKNKDNAIRALKAELSKLLGLKRGMMSDLLTGKVSVVSLLSE